jgi:hypothetical protein
MNPDEIVMHVEQRNGVHVILKFLTEGISKPGESAHVHPHGEVTL